MIILDDNVINDILSIDSGIFEIVSRPDNGSSSTAIAILDKITSKIPESIGLFLESDNNYRDVRYYTQLINDTPLDQIIIERYSNPEQIDKIIKKYDFVDTVIIDDFFNCILYKNYKYIRNLFRSLRNYVDQKENRRLFYVNQYRTVINGDESSMKSMYCEHTEPFVDGKINVSKDDTNIHVTMSLSRPIHRKENLLESLMMSFV